MWRRALADLEGDGLDGVDVGTTGTLVVEDVGVTLGRRDLNGSMSPKLKPPRGGVGAGMEDEGTER